MSTNAVIDVGSNSVKLYVATRTSDHRWHDLCDCHEITRLAAGLHETDLLAPAAMDRTQAVIHTFTARARSLGAERIVAVGTMGLRQASNAHEFITRVETDCGIEIEVITGQAEARYSFLAVQASLGPLPGRVAVFDIGGGSTEVTCGKDEDIEWRRSFPVGAVSLTERYLPSDPVTPQELATLLSELATELNYLAADHRIEVLVGVGGTMTNLSAAHHGFPSIDPQQIQGTSLARSEIDALVELFRAETIAQRKQIVGLEPARADVILAGAGIAVVIMQKLAIDRLTVSARGLRHGVMADRFG